MNDMTRLTSSDIELVFSAASGGGLASFRVRSPQGFINIMRPASAEALQNADPQGLACFTSIPYVGRINRGTFDYAGQTFRLPANQEGCPHPLHGVIWRRPALITQHGDNCIEITHHIQEDDLPYHFNSRQIWTLSGKKVAIVLEVTNLALEEMPFGLGLHPFFLKTPATEIEAGVGEIIINDENIMPTHLSRLESEQDFSAGTKSLAKIHIDNCFMDWNGSCRIHWPEHSTTLEMQAQKPLSYFVFCNPVDTNWFCANPVTHYNDAHNNPLSLEKTGLVGLKQGETLRAELSLMVV